MASIVKGGFTTYGQLAGILMTESTIPRIPGDPGHAETFDFPVRYAVIRDFPFDDLIDIKRDHLENVIEAALSLQREGVHFVAADCGLFSVFQKEIADRLDIPFIGSPLTLLPLLERLLPAHLKIGLITGDTRLLKEAHLTLVGADPDRLIICGLDDCEEFQKVVVNRGQELNVEAMRNCVLKTSAALFSQGEPVGAILLECTNLASFRFDLQTKFLVPVFDIVSLIEFFAGGYLLKPFTSRFIPLAPKTGPATPRS